MNDDPIRITFPADDATEIKTTPPAEHPPPARFDADPDISAEIAVERGLATEEEKAWHEWRSEPPLVIPTGNSEEFTVGADQVPAPGDKTPGIASTFDRDDDPVIPNDDGTKTTLKTTRPDPREAA